MPNGLGKKNRDFVSEYITSNTSFFHCNSTCKIPEKKFGYLIDAKQPRKNREEFGFLMIEAHIRNTRNDTLRWVPCILVLHK